MTTVRPQLTDELAKVVLPAVQFDGLALAAVDPATLAAFWAAALSGTVHPTGADGLLVRSAPGRPDKEFIRIIAATGPRVAGTRTHVDIALPGADPRQLLSAGAVLVRSPGEDPWFVLADPEGNEFCAYPAVDERPPGIFELVVACRDARAQAQWWAALLGGDVADEGPACAVTGAPAFPWDYMLFEPVPEPKTARNRLHWHVELRDQDPSALVAVGATVLRGPTMASDLWVLADPEGNEFCAAPGQSLAGTPRASE